MTLITTNAGERTADTTVERRLTPEESVWNGVDTKLHEQFDAAKVAMEKGDEPNITNDDIVDLAYITHLHELETSSDTIVTADRIALVLLAMPRALRAMQEKHLPTRRDHSKKVLSQFNKMIASALTYMPPSMMDDFVVHLQRRSRNVMKGEWSVDSLPAHEIAGCVRGAELELAVSYALEAEIAELEKEWEVTSSTTAQDLAGIDMTVVNERNQELSLDIKAAAAFNEEIDRQVLSGSLRPADAQAARENRYFYARIGDLTSKTTAYRCVVDADQFGPVKHCKFEDTLPVFEFVEDRFDEGRARQLQKFGNTAMIS